MNYFTNTLKGKNEWWRYLVLILISFVGGAQIIGAIPFGIVAVFKSMQLGINPTSENIMNLKLLEIDQNFGLFMLMIPFVVGLFTLLLLYKPFHKRSYKSVFSGYDKIRWGRFFSAAGIWAGFMAIYLIIDYYLNPGDFQLNFNLSSFIPLVIVTLIMIPIQASYEEVLFRGYLAQGIGTLTKNKLLAIIIPALLFGLMHIINPEVEKYGFWLVMPQYITFGLVFGLISVLDDGIELAMGAHTANNAFLSLFITSDASALQTPAVFVNNNMDPVKDLIVMVLISIVFILTLSKLYAFKFSSLFSKISKPENDTEIENSHSYNLQ